MKSGINGTTGRHRIRIRSDGRLGRRMDVLEHSYEDLAGGTQLKLALRLTRLAVSFGHSQKDPQVLHSPNLETLKSPEDI